LNRGYTDCVLRAGKREGSASVWYYRDEALIAVDAMNDALSYGIAKRCSKAAVRFPRRCSPIPPPTSNRFSRRCTLGRPVSLFAPATQLAM
jgi:hypothetical protein